MRRLKAARLLELDVMTGFTQWYPPRKELNTGCWRGFHQGIGSSSCKSNGFERGRLMAKSRQRVQTWETMRRVERVATPIICITTTSVVPTRPPCASVSHARRRYRLSSYRGMR